MKFRVIGANRDTGARMTLEFEAESKAAAERKALQSNMTVNRVENISEGYPVYSSEGTSPRRRRSQGGMLRWIILVAIAAAIWWFFIQKHPLPHF